MKKPILVSFTTMLKFLVHILKSVFYVLDNKLIFKNILRINCVNRILVLVRLKDFVIYWLAVLSLLFISHLLGHIWTTGMLYIYI